MPMPDLPILLTADETAEILRTTRLAIYAMVERDQLPGVTRIGRRVLIRSEALMQWLDERSGMAADKAPARRPERHRPVRR